MSTCWQRQRLQKCRSGRSTVDWSAANAKVAEAMMDALSRLTAALADRYRIERELGQGGMATVYLAEDLKHDRQVAIKVLREDLSASLGAGRFLREIKIAAQLQHPHILPLLDSGEADGFLYFVMPYIKGSRCASASRAKASCRCTKRCG